MVMKKSSLDGTTGWRGHENMIATIDDITEFMSSAYKREIRPFDRGGEAALRAEYHEDGNIIEPAYVLEASDHVAKAKEANTPVKVDPLKIQKGEL